VRTLHAIELDIGRAKKRLAQLRAEEYPLLMKVACRGCGAKVGCVCVKEYSRKKTAVHAERRKDARGAACSPR
jgi:hypothetical protein